MQHALCISTGGVGVSWLAFVKASDRWPAHTWSVTYYYVAILRNSWVSLDFAGAFFKQIHGVAQVARYHTEHILLYYSFQHMPHASDRCARVAETCGF